MLMRCYLEAISSEKTTVESASGMYILLTSFLVQSIVRNAMINLDESVQRVIYADEEASNDVRER